MSEPAPRRPLPPPLAAHPPGFGRATPPAIFGPILGLFGLGLLLRALAGRLALDPLAALAETALGALLLLHAFAVVAYLAKPLRRPAALVEDLGTLPGRAGLAAGLAAGHLAAAALVPHTPGLALGLTLAALAGQGALMAGMLALLAKAPPEGRAVGPAFHLIFVGHILAPFALVPLGWTGLAAVLFWVGLATAAAIWALSLPRAGATPPPLRPNLVIHLAPASVLAAVAALLGWGGLAQALAGVAAVLAAGLAVAAARGWLLAAGFSPFWGALTFPLAAFGQAMLRAGGVPGLWLAAAVAALASVAIPWIALRILRQWPGGGLARRTNAAVA